MTPNRTILLVLLLALFSACRKDFDDTVKVTEITPDPTVKVESTIYGVVVDDSNEPLPFTNISLGNDEAITDKQGVFIMKNIYAPQYLGVLHVHHLNYTPEYHIINAFVGDTLRLFLHLSKERILGTIQPNTVKTTIKEELLHLFPDRVSYKDELQNEYTKTVYLRGRVVNRIKSIQQNTHSIAVKGNSKGILQQFALFEMYYRKESGFDLLYSNKNIPAQWDIIPELQTIAPTQLTVWHYDESTDLWRKSGEAKKVGTTYRFEVKESGKYCLASFSSMKYFSGTIKTSKGGNASFVPLSVKYGTFENTQHISTTHKGKFTVFLPENTSFSFNGYKLCGDVILSKTFSTTTQNTLLESPITLDDEENMHRFKGVLLDCDNNKLLNGYVSVSGEQWSNQIYLSNSDGKFAGTLETCKDEKIIIEGFDPNKSSSGLPISLYLNSRVSEGLVTSCKEDIAGKAYVVSARKPIKSYKSAIYSYKLF